MFSNKINRFKHQKRNQTGGNATPSGFLCESRYSLLILDTSPRIRAGFDNHYKNHKYEITFLSYLGFLFNNVYLKPKIMLSIYQRAASRNEAAIRSEEHT